MKFYLPNFEDFVDPEYNFLTDQPSPNSSDRWLHDKLAHEFFEEPIFDGMLVSKASLSPISERYIRKTGGIHPFTRLSQSIPVMGDCGAFTYLLSEKPVYTVQQTLDYYQELGFDYGVSLDHLSFVTVEMLEETLKQGKVKERWWQGKTNEQVQSERFDLTLRNAREFLELHTRQKLTFRPIGIAQGSNPELYYSAVEQLIKMGYEYIAIGGLIRSSDRKIVAILERIQPLIKNGIKVHIFGVARIALVPHFNRLNVTSADSSAPLRRAFLGENNYWAIDEPPYEAIRVPEVNPQRNKRGVYSLEEVLQGNSKLSLQELAKLEQNALISLRAYDKGEVTLDETLEVVLEYDQLYGDKRDHRSAYLRTLGDKPWQKCDCSICKSIGVEVIIFRGNNRNRRRGFHNVRTFYAQLHQIQGDRSLAPQNPFEEEGNKNPPRHFLLDEVRF
ncbi:MAG: tRNA-guanine transglycosylase DpdA [Ktedonobacteraceae bacterium]